MADKDSGAKGSQGERILNIPLRAECIKVPKNKRAKKAMGVIRDYTHKHTKSYDIKVSQKVNEKIWIRGIQKPPSSIKVKISTDSDGVVHVRLPEEIVKEKKKEDKGRLAKMMETVSKEKSIPGVAGPKEEILKKGKKKEEEAEEKPTEKPAEAKKEAKSEEKKEEKPAEEKKEEPKKEDKTKEKK